MVYAVASRVLHACESSFGRALVWRDGRPLVLVPHAPASNAWFVGDLNTVFFGTARAERDRSAPNRVGQDVYFCLSFEAIAHELAHAVLWEVGHWDGTTLDNVALQEGLADLVALLVRCTEPVLLARTIRESGLKLGSHPNLFTIGEQFGAAAGGNGPVRRYPLPRVEPGDSAADDTDPWMLGGQLTSALLEAFAAVVEARHADLFRWSGTDPEAKWFHPDLVTRLADGAANLAGNLLRSALGAVDFLPPGSPTIGDFVRAFVTADQAMAGPDHEVLRACVIQACQIRGLVPAEVGSLAEDSIAWPRATIDPAVAIPHAAEVLQATAQALEHRRYCGIDPDVAADLGAKVERTRRSAQPRWRRDIGRYLTENRAAFGWPGDDPLRVTSVTGAFQTDGGGALQARVFLHVTRPSFDPPARPGRPATWGATVVTDSQGAIDYVICPYDAPPRRKALLRTNGDRSGDAEREDRNAALLAQLRG
jgi:hypothetical protein